MSNATEQTIFVRNLIDAVREHRCLYDKKDTAYFNRREKEKAWHIIGQQLGRSDVACHRRWKLLREKFAKELKKRDRALKNGEHFQSDWTCFQNIMYIEEHIAPRKKSDKLPFVLTKNLSSKRMVYEHASSADTTEKRPYCPTGLDFLAQLSKATLQATQLSDSNSFSERNLRTETKLAETDESVVDEMHSATTGMESPTSPDTDTECSISMTSRTNTPTTLSSANAVDALLQELRTNKESSLNFVRNLTNALKINNLDIFKDIAQPLSVQQSTDFSINEDTNPQKHAILKPNFIAETVPISKDIPTNDEVVRSTLLRVNGIHNMGSKVSQDNVSTEVTSTANQPMHDLRDEIFGKMVITMLADITDEECKDDAKFGIMQVLINAKRACRNKQFTRQ